MEYKADKDLAIELTIAVVKARADIISSMEAGSINAKRTNMNDYLSDEKVTETFDRIYATLSESD